MTKKIGRTISIILFIIGVFAALTFAVSIIWANFELPFYFDYSFASVRSENQSFSDLNCPTILTTSETGTVSTDITNQTNKTLNPKFRGEISYLGGIVREVEFMPTILPGETSHIEIEIDEDDIVFNFMILVRTYQYPTYKTPSQIGSCAILMLPVTFLTGNQIYYLSLLLIILLLVAGIFLWVKNNRPMQGLARNAFKAMVALALLLLTAIIAGINGVWIPGVMMLVVIVLLIVVAIAYFGSSPLDNQY